MKIIEADMNVKLKVDSFKFVYGVNGGRRFYKFQIKWLDKQRKASIDDIIAIINRLRLESNNERANEKGKCNSCKYKKSLVSWNKVLI